MAYVWAAMFAAGVIAITVTQGGGAATAAMLSAAGGAVTLSLELAGAYLLFMGVLGVAREARLMDALSKRLRGAVRWLFPGAGSAAGAITLCLSANMLGMGNAATPLGIEAMKELDEKNPHPGVATDEMCVLVAVNGSLQLLPTGLIALREAAGSAEPASIVLPCLVAQLAATAAAVVLCRLCLRRGRGRRARL